MLMILSELLALRVQFNIVAQRPEDTKRRNTKYREPLLLLLYPEISGRKSDEENGKLFPTRLVLARPSGRFYSSDSRK